MEELFCCRRCFKEVFVETDINKLELCVKCLTKHNLILELKQYGDTFIIIDDIIHLIPFNPIQTVSPISISYSTNVVLELLDDYIVTVLDDINYLVLGKITIIDLECYTV